MGSIDPVNSVAVPLQNNENNSWLITIDKRIFNSIPIISAGAYTISLLGKGFLHFVSDESLNGHTFLKYLKNEKALADCVEYRVTSYVCGSVLSIIPGCYVTEIPSISTLAKPSTEGPQKQEAMNATDDPAPSQANPDEDEKGELLLTEQEGPPELTFMERMLLSAIDTGPAVPIYNANLSPALRILSEAKILDLNKDYAGAAEKYKAAAQASKNVDINFSKLASIDAEVCENKAHLEIHNRSLKQAKDKIIAATTLHTGNKFEEEINTLEEAIMGRQKSGLRH